MAETPDRETRLPPGCLVCRSRKVRCDRTAPHCRNCDRLGVQCPGYDDTIGSLSRRELLSSVENIYRASGVERRKIGSCEECQKSKSRCSRTRPHCRRCTSRSLKCTYSRHDTNSDHAESPSSPSTTSDSYNRHGTMLATGGSQWSTTVDSHTGHLRWLFAELPPQDPSLLKILVDLYFNRTHPLRCLGFVHKPSFLQALDRGSLLEDYGEPLVCIIAAIGASTYSLEHADDFAGDLVRNPGESWAERARELAMRDLGSPSLTSLMALLLICEYSLNIERFALAFSTLGCCQRITRLLGLETVKGLSCVQDLSAATNIEAEKRALWTCYVLDSFLGSGVDGNLFWKDDFPHIGLPCSESNFIAQSIPHPQDLITLDSFASTIGRHVDYRSHIIYLASLRTKVLRLIRTKNQLYDVWQHQSPFLQIIQQLELWHQNLAEQLQVTELNAYVHKELSVLGAVYSLHFLYHSIASDLTRISLPGYSFPLASAFQTAPIPFRKQCQERCRYHADEVVELVRSGLAHGRIAFDDMHCSMTTFESTKIQIIHTATATTNSPAEREKAEMNIRTNMELLDLTHVHRGKPNNFHRALLPLLRRFGFHDVAAEWGSLQGPQPISEEQAEVTGPPEAGYLSNLAPFRLAKTEVQARQKPRIMSSSGGDDRTKSDSSARQPPTISPTIPSVPTITDAFMQPQFSILPSTMINDGFYTESLSTQQMAGPANPSIQSAEAYVRLAGEMSDFITWDMSEASEFLDFDPNNIGSWMRPAR